MRRVILVAVCTVSFLITLPAPADAWWYWLDEYSGPGPFTGFDGQWRLACVNDPAPREAARKSEELRRLAVALGLPGTGGQSREAIQSLVVSDAAAEDLAAPIRISADPGAHVLRSLASFKKGHQQFLAGVFGAGCLGQPKNNPIGSLNFRLAYLWSIHNRLEYAGAKPGDDGPKVRLLEPELSFTVFVDERKSVEIGSAMGVSTAFIDKKGVSPFSRFYWRPLILTVSPASLLRSNGSKGLRALTLTSSIVIMPQGLKDTDFGAIPGTFHTSREMQGLFGFTFDVSRF